MTKPRTGSRVLTVPPRRASRRCFAATGGVVLAVALAPAHAGAVVGGTPARASAHPWFAKLPLCGGALIAPDRVATAAHCVAGLPLRDVANVRFGSRAARAATGIAVHPSYVRRALGGTANTDAPAD